jgi:23S rRNA pseudouridine955/2504/2580 synthase/23S rRNA pseudouridine1911/1915/1917 synthase
LSQHDEEERPMLNRVALHSSQLKFKDAEGKDYHLEADLPKDIKALVQQLRKNLYN